MLLDGRVAIVSGIGPGMGRDISVAFAREGANLGLGARTEEKLRAVAADVEGQGRKAVWRPTNIVEAGQCEALAKATHDTFGRIDVLVNNAFAHPPFTTVEDSSERDWDLAHKVNVKGSLNMTQAVLPYMKAQGSGSIVMISSQSARNAEPLSGPYAASKAALLTMARTLAQELGPDGIRVNSVVPGYIDGPSLDVYFEYLAKEQGRTPQEVRDEVAGRTCLRTIPHSSEIADAVVFFASDLSRVVTGQSLDVNGGDWLT